jgi:hypothetical protein
VDRRKLRSNARRLSLAASRVTPPSLRLAPGPSSTVPSLRLAVGALPALERVLDFTNRGPLILISGFQTPTAIRRLGHVRLARWLERRGVRGADRLAHAAAAAASRQTVEISGASAATSLIARLAQAVLELDRQLADLDRQVSGMFRAHPDAAIITSLTGICDVLGAEFLAAPGGSLAGFASADYLAGYAWPRPHPIRLRLPDRQSAPASAI